MEHQDIIDLINEGKVEEAQALVDNRNARDGISGEDQAIIAAAFEAQAAQAEAAKPAKPAKDTGGK